MIWISQRNGQSPKSVAHVRQQRHESSSFDRIRNGVLRNGRATGFPAADDAAVAVDQFLQQFNVLVINVHRTGTFAIDEQGILTNGFRFDL